MQILFLHNNFPAQFRGLLQYLMRQGHSITFLSVEGKAYTRKNLQHLVIKPNSVNSPDSNSLNEKYLDNGFQGKYRSIGKKIAISEMFFTAFKKLDRDGFVPDLIVAHSGWGCALHAKTIFPKARLAVYGEWWFRWDADDYDFDNYSPWSPPSDDKNRLAERYMNLQLSHEIVEADFVWSPTEYQKNQFPPLLREHIHVIHEGVDVNFFSPSSPSTVDQNLFTYATRGMEPMRGFEYFVRIASQLLKLNDQARLTIGGKDKCFYRNVSVKKSFGDLARDHFSENNQSNRVDWPGLTDLKTYRNLLQSSGCHFYFTRPFVPSWSILESMSCGCMLVATDHPCVTEIVGTGDDSAALLVDHRKPSESVERIQDALSNPTFLSKKRNLSRERALLFDRRRTVRELASALLAL